MNILKQELAPITDEGWKEINDQSKKVFKNNLIARNFVDIDGPKGIDFGAVSNGRLAVKESHNEGGVNYGIHKIQPLIEVRKPFELDLWELDNASRGSETIDLSPLEEAAYQLAEFENQTIFSGFEEANIQGMKKASAHEIVDFSDSAEQLLYDLGQQVSKLKDHAVGGPYYFVVNAENWSQLMSYVEGYPLINQIKNLIGGEVVQARGIDHSFLVSERGGDFRLTVGQDISVGFDRVDTENIKLFFTESFTFQVLSPEAVVVFK